MNFKEFFSLRKNSFFWINIVAMVVVVVLLIWGVLFGLDIYTQHGKAVRIPDIEGKSIQEASQLLSKSNLRYMVVDSNYVKSMPEGCVLDCKPSVGESVKEGRVVYLTLNTMSVPLIEVPDVADNSSYRQAAARIIASGFKLDSVQYVPGEKDWVYGVKYKTHQLTQGEKVPMGATLSLMVGDGGSMPTDSLTDESVATPAESTDESWFN